MMMAFREALTSTSLAPVMYRSRRSLFSSWLVASRSKRACSRTLCDLRLAKIAPVENHAPMQPALCATSSPLPLCALPPCRLDELLVMKHVLSRPKSESDVCPDCCLKPPTFCPRAVCPPSALPKHLTVCIPLDPSSNVEFHIHRAALAAKLMFWHPHFHQPLFCVIA